MENTSAVQPIEIQPEGANTYTVTRKHVGQSQLEEIVRSLNTAITAEQPQAAAVVAADILDAIDVLKIRLTRFLDHEPNHPRVLLEAALASADAELKDRLISQAKTWDYVHAVRRGMTRWPKKLGLSRP